jgi:Glycosyltransferase family 87
MRQATMATAANIHEAHRAVLKAFAILGAFFLAAAAGVYLYGLDLRPPIPRDGSSLVVGRDFLNFWMYGRAAALADPSRWYDAETYQRVLAALLGPDYPGQNWSYPPTIMLIAAPFGRLGYLPALAVWSVVSLAIFVSTAARWLGDGRALFALAVSPAAVFCLMSGQSSFLSTAILIGIFTLLDRRPIVAGVLIGLLTLKPQLGLLFPVVLIASARWRVFAAAAVTALALAALAAALFGTQAWVDFVTLVLPTQNIVLADPDGIATPFYPTVFMNLRGIGLSYATAMTAQAGIAVAAVGALAWAFYNRPNADPRLLFALFAACSIAAVPYFALYDTLALTAAAMGLLTGGFLRTRGAWLTRLIFWLPLLQIGLGTLHIPGPALIAPAFALYLVQRLKGMRVVPAQRLPAPV